MWGPTWWAFQSSLSDVCLTIYEDWEENRPNISEVPSKIKKINVETFVYTGTDDSSKTCPVF